MERINKSLIYLAGIFMLVLTGLANLQVLTRFVLHVPFPWVEEAIRYIMVYLVLIMSSTAIFLNSHLNVDMLDLILKGKLLKVVLNLRTTIILVFAVVYSYLTFKLIMETIQLGQVSPALQISMAWPLLALLIGGVLMAINCIYLLIPRKDKSNQSLEMKEG